MISSLIMKNKYKHPMHFYDGVQNYKIVQISLKEENLYGKVDFEKKIIYLDPDQDLPDYKKTLLHEIIHIGYDCFGLNNDGNMPTITNEYITTVTTNMMHHCFYCNRELFKFIFSYPK